MQAWSLARGIGSAPMPIMLMISTSLLCLGCRATMPTAVYEGCRMGECHQIFIQSKAPLGDGRWRFRTRTEIRRDPTAGLGAEPDMTERETISSWQQADCFQSMIDGQVITAIARSGVERGLPQLMQSLCGPNGAATVP